MKYPIESTTIIDVTKPPYNADNTGKTDCTKALRQAIDDCLAGYITGLEELRQKLLDMAKQQDGNVYVGSEAGKFIDGEVYMTFPEKNPPSKIIYFPNGTYLVSDTVSYTFKNLSVRQAKNYTCELCRNIHILGESKEKTLIRLADHSPGFEKGSKKPLICFNIMAEEDKETTNCAQMNTLEDITIDCGKGNEGVIGVRYASSNCGRIENIDIKTDAGFCGIDFDYGSECCVSAVSVKGFDWGMKSTFTGPVIFDEIDLSGNKKGGILSRNANMCCKDIAAEKVPAFCLEESECGRYYFEDELTSYAGEKKGNFIFNNKESLLDTGRKIPQNHRSENAEDWVCVDDFGAIGDGKTDSANAIQKAMNSGKSHIIFGEGTYLIGRTVKIPKTVQTVDFMYCSFISGYSLLVGEMDCAFDICEESDHTFFAENFMSLDEFAGFFRMFKHSAKRNAVFSDISVFGSLYFNTVGGSEVYFDNCFTLTNHYAQDACLHRDGYIPVFCKMIPVELHGQKVYARNLNIERAEIELLNDNSELIIDGYKVEGPGVLVKSVNGGKTRINLFNAAWWGNKIVDNMLFEVHHSQIDAVGGNVFCYPQEEMYCGAVYHIRKDTEQRINLKECSILLDGKDALGRDIGRLIERLTIIN